MLCEALHKSEAQVVLVPNVRCTKYWKYDPESQIRSSSRPLGISGPGGIGLRRDPRDVPLPPLPSDQEIERQRRRRRQRQAAERRVEENRFNTDPDIRQFRQRLQNNDIQLPERKLTREQRVERRERELQFDQMMESTRQGLEQQERQQQKEKQQTTTNKTTRHTNNKRNTQTQTQTKQNNNKQQQQRTTATQTTKQQTTTTETQTHKYKDKNKSDTKQ